MAAMSFVDEPVNHFSTDLTHRNNTVRTASKYITQFGGPYEVYALVGLASYGIVFKRKKIRNTALLATQSYITAGVFQGVLKFLTARQRPLYIDKQTHENEPTFHGPFFHLKDESNSNSRSSSFPSGHTTVAFAVASVFAMEYRNKPLIPVVCYGAATLIGLSRLTEGRHWPTDILMGAALGFLSGKQVVHSYHRFSGLKQPLRSMIFNLHYFRGQFLPAITYRFK